MILNSNNQIIVSILANIFPIKGSVSMKLKNSLCCKRRASSTLNLGTADLSLFENTLYYLFSIEIDFHTT